MDDEWQFDLEDSNLNPVFNFGSGQRSIQKNLDFQNLILKMDLLKVYENSRKNSNCII